MKSFPRFITALFLTAIYAVITMSPLAPLVMRSPVIAHALTGECVGVHDICGCSAEQRANQTCCCWKKKLRHGHNKTGNCCGKKQHSDKPVLSCACPCGDSKQKAFLGPLKSEHLPHFSGYYVPVAFSDIFYSSYQRQRYDRFGDPPDPPPKLLFS